MTSKFLFAHQHRLWSSLLFIISFLALIFVDFYDFRPEIFDVVVFSPFEKDHMFSDITGNYWQGNNVLDEILTIIAIVSGLIWAFSKERIEDEMISELRKQSLILSVYINYGFYILATIFVYGMDFLKVLMLNVFTVLIFFLIIFNWKKYQLKKSSDEE
ncbi:hypothetical protein BST97_06325 [Nonlabens spongiae]|uniref:Uncharacterized protein n=1 Tax=Nonlabens spongiae TaxID=331648 RepID=A0A1W6MJ70_9FLAO|nr:hypothetical protein [Nonlabens spongiae]ARN77640.1 hypothetical protein BST97_06325 [Nonlabens spongiae]